MKGSNKIILSGQSVIEMANMYLDWHMSRANGAVKVTRFEMKPNGTSEITFEPIEKSNEDQ